MIWYGFLFLSEGNQHLINNNSVTMAMAGAFLLLFWPAAERDWAQAEGGCCLRVEVGSCRHEHLPSAAWGLPQPQPCAPFGFDGEGGYSYCIRCGCEDFSFQTLYWNPLNRAVLSFIYVFYYAFIQGLVIKCSCQEASCIWKNVLVVLFE